MSEGSTSRQRKNGHTPMQKEILEWRFAECTHPDGAMLETVSQETGISVDKVKYWFQNRRTQGRSVHDRMTLAKFAEVNDSLKHREEEERRIQQEIALRKASIEPMKIGILKMNALCDMLEKRCNMMQRVLEFNSRNTR